MADNFFIGILKKKFPRITSLIEPINEHTATTPTRELHEEVFFAVGTHYYTENINKLACVNPDWKSRSNSLIGKPVYKYNFIHKPVKLILESQNPSDPNAVMVVIAGEKVGYISRDENLHVLSILQRGEIKYISAFISGGPYKVKSGNGDIFRDEKKISVKVKIGYIL